MRVSSGNSVVTIVDNYGEPHINYDVFAVLVRDNKIVDQKKASYYQRYEKNQVYYEYIDLKENKWVMNALLADGRMLTIFDDEGNEFKKYDLPTLVGKDEEYSVLGVGEDYLVVRPNRTGFLTLINLKDNSTVVLVDKLLSGRDLEYARSNDIPYRGDELRFVGDNPGELIFYYASPFDGKDNKNTRLTYKRNTGE